MTSVKITVLLIISSNFLSKNLAFYFPFSSPEWSTWHRSLPSSFLQTKYQDSRGCGWGGVGLLISVLSISENHPQIKATFSNTSSVSDKSDVLVYSCFTILSISSWPRISDEKRNYIFGVLIKPNSWEIRDHLYLFTNFLIYCFLPMMPWTLTRRYGLRWQTVT